MKVVTYTVAGCMYEVQAIYKTRKVNYDLIRNGKLPQTVLDVILNGKCEQTHMIEIISAQLAQIIGCPVHSIGKREVFCDA